MLNCDLNQFEIWAKESWESLPEEFRDQVANLAIFVEEEPSRELLESMGISSRRSLLLGVYHGVPLHLRGASYMNVLPDSIILFRQPILRICKNEKAIRKQIRETLIHEIGHYFGMSEEEIRDAMED
jgi:predicted Zn-dependent protease with MMP-like domain